ncbi:MAG: dockerin type I repeat-containing protein [Clostridia bacterium]|nr:dockerin type I repeat-containing protein [Clostridia bacterium]
MKKLISLALALIIAAAVPFAVFADQMPEIVKQVDGSGELDYEITAETDTEITLRVTFSPAEGWELTLFSATGILGAFNELLAFEEYTDGSAPEYLEFTASKDYLAINLVALYAEAAEPGLMGDIDGDGEITVGDALIALRIAARLAEANEDHMRVGDVDYDGEITVGDALLILRVAARLEEQSSLERR